MAARLKKYAYNVLLIMISLHEEQVSLSLSRVLN